MAMLRLKRYLICGVILSCFICCLNIAVSSAATDYWPTEGWRSSTPEKQGMQSGMLADMLEIVKEKKYVIESITIVRNGYIVMDAYFFPFEKDTKHVIHSCTKSITSALVGIALDKGYLKDINQPVLKFFPEKSVANLDDRKKVITLEHLLTMSSGLQCTDSYEHGFIGMVEMTKSEDWTQYVLDLPMAERPGQVFEYCSGLSYLLSVIIQKTTNT